MASFLTVFLILVPVFSAVSEQDECQDNQCQVPEALSLLQSGLDIRGANLKASGEKEFLEEAREAAEQQVVRSRHEQEDGAPPSWMRDSTFLSQVHTQVRAMVPLSQCQQILATLSGDSEKELMVLCHEAKVFSDAACARAKHVLAGRIMDTSLTGSVCKALLQNPTDKKASDAAIAAAGAAGAAASSAAAAAEAGIEAVRSTQISLAETAKAIQHRTARGATGLAALEATLQHKAGSPDTTYLVKTAVKQKGPQQAEDDRQNTFPPVNSVDVTVQSPPDADGNFFNTPKDGWKKNKDPSK